MDADAIRRAARDLRRTARGFEADLESSSARFADYRDDVRAAKVAEERARLEAQARNDARLAVKLARASVEAQRFAVSGARQSAESRVDHARVDRLRAELAAQIALGVGGSSVSASGVVQGEWMDDPRFAVIRDTLDRAKETRDVELAHAVRLAGAELVGKAAHGDPTHSETVRARDLARELNAAVEVGVAESPAARQLADMQAAHDELVTEVRSAERTITGEAFSIFSPVTPWAAEVLGETVEDFGGGLAQDARSEPMGEPPAPAAEAEAA